MTMVGKTPRLGLVIAAPAAYEAIFRNDYLQLGIGSIYTLLLAFSINHCQVSYLETQDTIFFNDIYCYKFLDQ